MRITNSSFFWGRRIVYDETKYRDLEGNIVERNPIEYPFSYEPYVLFKSLDYQKTDREFCSDLVEHFNFTEQEIDSALNQMGFKNSGTSEKRISWKNPQQVERLMSILLKKNVKCTAIMEVCNCDHGYPYWIVYIQS